MIVAGRERGEKSGENEAGGTYAGLARYLTSLQRGTDTQLPLRAGKGGGKIQQGQLGPRPPKFIIKVKLVEDGNAKK